MAKKTVFCETCGQPAIGYPLVEALIKNENPQVYPPRLAWAPFVYNLPRCSEHLIRDANAFLAMEGMKEDLQARAQMQNVEISERWRVRIIWLKTGAAERIMGEMETEFEGQYPVA